MKVEISNGELLDKISILMIKSERIKDKRKLVNINNELSELAPYLIELADFFEMFEICRQTPWHRIVSTNNTIIGHCGDH